MSLVIPGTNTMIASGQYPNLRILVDAVEGGAEMTITTPALNNMITITCSSYTSTSQNQDYLGTSASITTTDTIHCQVNTKALTQMVKDHSRRNFGAAMPKSFDVLLDCVTGFAAATQSAGARASSFAVSQALVAMLSVIDEMSANHSSGAKYLTSERTMKKAQTALTHRNFLEVTSAPAPVLRASAQPFRPAAAVTHIDDILNWDAPAAATSSKADPYDWLTNDLPSGLPKPLW